MAGEKRKGGLLSWLGRAIIKTGIDTLLGGLPLGTLLVNIADEAWNGWTGDSGQGDRRVELEFLAACSPAEFEAAIETQMAASEEFAALPPEEREAVHRYLSAVQPAIRQRLRRPEDPSGTTVPASLSLSSGADLVEYLPTRPARFRPGDPVPGAPGWVLTEVLGVGGFGEVWKAANLDVPDMYAAFKFCLDGGTAAALRRDVANLHRIRQLGRIPGIIELQDVYLRGDPPFIRFEYVSGGELTRLLEAWHATARPDPYAIAAVIHRIATILRPLHSMDPPLIHRDLKPANILVNGPGPGPDELDLRIADFGIGGVAASREALQSALQQSNAVSVAQGSYTPLYASPEQMRGGSPTPTDDVYSIGVIWYQALAGNMRESFPADWQEELLEREVPAGHRQLLGACLAGKAIRRPHDAGELADRLSKLLHETSPLPPHPEVSDGGGKTGAAGPIADPNATDPSATELLDAAAAAEDEPAIDPMALITEPPAPIEPPRRPTTDFRTHLAQRVSAFARGNGTASVTTPPPAPPRPAVAYPEGSFAGDQWSANGLNLEFCWCPAGSFIMGSPAHEPGRKPDENQVEVTFRRGFWIGQFPVTQADYAAIMELDPPSTKAAGMEPHRMPVFDVTWEDAHRFCQRLTQQEAAEGRLPEGLVYRLPTEAEWEYACRAESSAPFAFGMDLDGYANIRGAAGRPTAVDAFPANEWGIYDMHGNIWEWCLDLYTARLPGGVDPCVLDDPDAWQRVIRGGSWLCGAESARSAARRGGAPTGCDNDLGFRLALAEPR